MPKTAYASDCGIPKSVKTIAQLPNRGYVGATVYCEEDSNLYVFNGSTYAVVGGSSASAETTPPATIAIPTVKNTNNDSYPANPNEGDLVYVLSTHAPYVYNGSAWKKVTIAD